MGECIIKATYTGPNAEGDIDVVVQCAARGPFRFLVSALSPGVALLTGKDDAPLATAADAVAALLPEMAAPAKRSNPSKLAQLRAEAAELDITVDGDDDEVTLNERICDHYRHANKLAAGRHQHLVKPSHHGIKGGGKGKGA